MKLTCLFIVVACLGKLNSLSVTMNYGIVLDAGSSSTKIRIYAWQEVLMGVPHFDEAFYHKVSPGLSSLGNDVNSIENYFIDILEVLKNTLPESKWPTTQIYLMATAGLRLLDEHVTRNIMDAVHAVLNKDNQFNPFAYEPENAHILAGEEEALFAWLTINYMTEYFKSDRPDADSYGLVEVGGGSAQIAFIPEDPIFAGKMPTTVAGREFGVYCHSHLSYGSNMISDRAAQYLVSENPDSNAIVHPCMLSGDTKQVAVGNKVVTMVGGGNASHCETILGHFLTSADDTDCSPKPCSIGQVYQPSVDDRRFYTFGLVYIMAEVLGVLQEAGPLNLQLLQSSARLYCGTSLAEATSSLGIPQKYASKNCEDGLYISLLFEALGFPLNTQNIVAAKKVNGESVAWSLGAMLYEEERNRYQEFMDNHFRNSSFSS